jgi:glycosyltransferase involved in cell wall biosynthesis
LDTSSTESSVITLGSKPGYDTFSQLLKREGVRAVHFPLTERISVQAIRGVSQLLRKWKIDVLHTHGFKADVLGYYAARQAETALVSTIHGWCAAEGVRIRVYESISRYFLRRFDAVYPLSQELLDGMLRRGFDHQRVRLITNAVDASRFRDCRATLALRQRREPLRVLFVGRLRVAKGVLDLIDGFARARLPHGSHLTILGDGPDRERIVKRSNMMGVRPAVQLPGRADDVVPFFQTHDVIVLPSHSEGIPRSLMEAQAGCLPVIATNLAGIQELISDGVTGTLVPVANVDAVALALERVANEPEAALEMAREGKKTIDLHFSAQRLAREYAGEYARVSLQQPTR